MSSSKPRPEAKRPSWFQDTKSGSEKQTDYFLKIRKLQKELINREQHNLVNAMERLEQLQYPRRRPMVRNFPPSEKGASSAFPRRSYVRNLHGQKHIDKDKTIKPLKGKHLLPDRNTGMDNEELGSFSLEDIRYLYNRMLPVLNDQQIARIASDVSSKFPNEPSTYLLQPHLPSIPNVKRKTTTRLENRLKLLTLSEESQYRTLSVPKIATSLSLQKKKLPHGSLHHEVDEEKKAKKREQRKILLFDVDPNDSSLFIHAAHDKQCDDQDVDELLDNDDGNNENGPLPPPNSRPNSMIASKLPDTDEKTDHEGSCDITLDVSQEDVEPENSPPSQAEESKENSITENNEEKQIIVEQVVLSEKAVTNVDVTVNEEKTVDNQPMENTPNPNADTDFSQELNDDQSSDINISEPKVIINTSKPPIENLYE